MIQANHSNRGAGLFGNLITVVAIIILVIVVIWGLLHLASISSSIFSSLFGRSSSAINITAPSHATSTEAFVIQWKPIASATGTYSFVYQCKTGLLFKTINSLGENTIPCGTAFSTDDMDKILTITPYLAGTSTVQEIISIVFAPHSTSTSKQMRGNATINIHPSSAQSNIVSTTDASDISKQPAQSNSAIIVSDDDTKTRSANIVSTTTRRVSTQRSESVGIADLTVVINAVGVIDMYGNFVERAPVSRNEISAVRFVISNVGNARSSQYYFDADLPTERGYVYQSDTQPAMGPGDSVINTLQYTEASPNGGLISVAVYPGKSDARSANNTATHWTTGYLDYNQNSAPQYYAPQYYDYSTPQQYTYPTQQYYPSYQNYQYIY